MVSQKPHECQTVHAKNNAVQATPGGASYTMLIQRWHFIKQSWVAQKVHHSYGTRLEQMENKCGDCEQVGLQTQEYPLSFFSRPGLMEDPI
jgi:hypothetical protein